MRSRRIQVAAVAVLFVATLVPAAARADDPLVCDPSVVDCGPYDPAPKTPLEKCERTRDALEHEVAWWTEQSRSWEELHAARVADSEVLAGIAAQWQHRAVVQGERISRLEARVLRLRAKLQAARS